MRYARAFLITSLLTFPFGGMASAEELTPLEIKAALEEHILRKTEEGGGIFRLKDRETGKELALEFVRVRIIRQIEGHGYFADVDFRIKGEPEKLYDIDFWLKPKGDRLIVMDTQIHKEPKKLEGEWVQMARQPLPWWWAPAGEHPGEEETVRGWEVKAAIHEYITTVAGKAGGVFKIEDEKTGRELELEFVKIHDPVRKIEGKGYFACTDFRVKGGPPEKVYDLDFWLNEKEGKLRVERVTIHKEPKKVNGKWVKKPRYTFVKDQPVEIP